MVIETPRLRLRRLAPDRDAAFILELLNEPSFVTYIADRGVRTEEEAASYIEEWALASYRDHGIGPLRVALAEDDTPIGVCGLFQRDHLDLPDLGFALLERHHGRGYAWEAARAVMTHARDELALSALLATTAPENPTSIRLLERLGFTEIADASPGASRLFRWAAPPE